MPTGGTTPADCRYQILLARVTKRGYYLVITHLTFFSPPFFAATVHLCILHLN